MSVCMSQEGDCPLSVRLTNALREYQSIQAYLVRYHPPVQPNVVCLLLFVLFVFFWGGGMLPHSIFNGTIQQDTYVGHSSCKLI